MPELEVEDQFDVTRHVLHMRFATEGPTCVEIARESAAQSRTQAEDLPSSGEADVDDLSGRIAKFVYTRADHCLFKAGRGGRLPLSRHPTAQSTASKVVEDADKR